MASVDSALTDERVLTAFTTRGTRSLEQIAERLNLPEAVLAQLKGVLTSLVCADEVYMKVVGGRWEYGRVRASSRGKGGVS